jgi:hypothetical protein
VTRGAAFVAAFLVTIGRPAWWVMALATFLVRGGIVVAFLPIVILPSALALSNLFAPLLIPLALGRVEPALVIGPAALIALLLAWLVGGGRVAAGIDAALVAEAAAAAIDEGVGDDGPQTAPGPPADGPVVSGSAVAWRVLAVRLVAGLPLALALGIGVARIVEVTYAELTRPADVAIPLVVRVAGAVVNYLGLIVVAWALGEIIGGVATRGVVLRGRGHGRSIAWAVRTTASRPLSWAIPWLATTTLLVVVMGGALAAAALAWSRAVDALSDRFVDPFLTLAAMLVFVAVWLAAMFLGGVILAVRSTSQTFEHVRQDALQKARMPGPAAPAVPPGGGTFGVSPRGRTGDWSANDDGGSL